MLAPLQDGHSQVQLDSQLKFQKKPRGSEGVEPTLLLSNTFLGTLVPTVLKAEKVLVMKDETEAAQPPPLRPPVLTVFQTPPPPLLSLPSESARYVTEILQFAFSPLSTGWGKKKQTRAHSVSVKIWTP